jgi:hypothetical protein
MKIRIALLFAVFAAFCSISGCAQHHDETIAPQIVHSTQASYSGNVQNSGMVAPPSYGELGFEVNQDWVDAYDALLAKFGARLFPPRKPGDRNGIAKEAEGLYRISDAVLERYDAMNSIRKDEAKRNRTDSQ